MNDSVSETAGARTRFRFKSRRSNLDTGERDRNGHKVRRPRRSRHKDSHSPKSGESQRHKRRKTEHGDHAKPEEANDNFSGPEPFSDPEVAFREALFDAMADDEGAAYWESVYDQPLHIYPNTRLGPNGELERMTDEEYTAFVRVKMYEKTHEHLIAERKRKEDMRTKEKEQRQRNEQLDSERHSLQAQMMESLRRGERRRVQKQWNKVWNEYLRAWERLLSHSGQSVKDNDTEAKDMIPWPVKSARLSDVNREAIETFFHNAPSSVGGMDSEWQGLKIERIRWHPDKMQQRFGSLRLDGKLIRAVTSVFQVIDRMYNDSKTNIK